MELHEGQVAVVTGAASGIGLGIADQLARRGLSLVLADVENAALTDAEHRIAALGVPVLAVHTDVSDLGQVLRLADRTLERFDRVDVVCNNAGVNTKAKPSWAFDELDWKWVLGVDLWGVIHGIRAFVPHLVAHGRGHVVNTASIAGIAVFPGLAPYTVSKHAVVALSESLRAELDEAAPDVGVTVVCPSYVPTRIADAARNRPPELTPEVTETIPGRELDRSGSTPIDAFEVGRKVVAAIEANQLYLATHPGSAAQARARFERLLDGLGT